MADIRYKQVFERLKARILSQEFADGRPFPSEIAVARREGISRMTVHRAFAELRRLGLIAGGVGKAPRVVRARTSRRIGLIVPGLAYTEFFPAVVSAISQTAQARGYTLTFADVSAPDSAARAQQVLGFAESLVKSDVAGVILQPLELLGEADGLNRRLADVFARARIPVVLLDSDLVPLPERSGLDVVGINNFDAGYRLAEHLLMSGARKISFLMRSGWAPSVCNRLRGVRAAVGAHGATCRVLDGEPTDLAALRRHLRRGRPDAFVCGNDLAAAKFRQTLAAAGLAVPSDVLLAGFDDVQIAELMDPPLTTVRQPCAEIGRQAVDALLSRIAAPEQSPREIYLAAPLVVRRSTQR